MPYSDYQPREKVTFPPNIPTQVQLEGAGELQPSRNGRQEYRYFLANGRIMWVPEEVHAQIEQHRATEGDVLTITQRKRGPKAPAEWVVEHEAEEPAAAAIRRTSTAPASRAPIQEPPHPAPRPTAPAPAQAEAPLTIADQLASCLAAAIDAAEQAEQYATRRGLPIRWAAEDIRAMAATLYIQSQRGALR